MENSFIDQMAAKFEEENPGTTITVTQQGGDISANSAQFQAASIAGDGPDIRIQYAGGPTISFGQFFEDLEPYLTPEIIDSMSGFNVNREGFSADGADHGHALRRRQHVHGVRQQRDPRGGGHRPGRAGRRRGSS